MTILEQKLLLILAFFHVVVHATPVAGRPYALLGPSYVPPVIRGHAIVPRDIIASPSSYEGALATSAPGVWNKCAYDIDGVGKFTSRMHVANHSWSASNFSTSKANSRYFVKTGGSAPANFDPSQVIINSAGNLQLISNAVPASSSDTKSTSGQMKTAWNDITYGSVRTVAKGTANLGAVFGMFFYGNTSTHWETDIELRTGHPAAAYFTNQNEPEIGESQAAPFAWRGPYNPDKGSSYFSITDWHEYRLDWVSDKTTFYIDGILMWVMTDLVPQGPGSWRWNSWSNSNQYWSEGPNRQQNSFYIASIDLYVNRTGVTCGVPSV